MSAIALLVVRILLAVGLYAFLGWAFWTLYRDLVIQSRSLSADALPKLSLKVQGEQKLHSFQKLEVLVGREAGCDVHLVDSTVSGRHARLIYRQGQWWLEDLNSTNGTFLNQMRLAEPMALTVGDLIRCGQVEFEIENLA